MFVPEPGYGDVKRQQALLREAPISGAPAAAHALQAPRRAGKRGSGKTADPQQGPPQLPVDAPPPEVAYGTQIAQMWAEIASTPGASPLVQEYARMAEQGANG